MFIVLSARAVKANNVYYIDGIQGNIGNITIQNNIPVSSNGTQIQVFNRFQPTNGKQSDCIK